MSLPGTDAIDLAGLVQPVTFRDREFSMLRLDLLPAWASGNKYYKLKPYIEAARESHVRQVVTKGGMFSNHLDAFAQACRFFNLDAVCLIRSRQPDLANPTIKRLIDAGAAIHFLAPDHYAAYDAGKAGLDFPGSLFIPEGGLSVTGLHGAKELGARISTMEFDHIIIMGGTMCTAMGILAEAPAHANMHIIPAWKGCSSDYISNLLGTYSITPNGSWEVWPDYHFGGFARWDVSLFNLMMDFSRTTSVPLDPVYTGKMVYAFTDQCKSLPELNSPKTLLIHTGGLQGIEGFVYRFPEVWKPYLELASSLVSG